MVIPDAFPRDEFQEIYRKERPRLLAFARKLTHDAAAAQDAVQQATLRVLASGRRPAGDMAAYLCIAVRNAAVDEHRAKLRRNRDRALCGRGGDTPFWLISRAEGCRAVRAAVDSLPLCYREVVLLHLWTELSFREIAEALDEPIFTIASRYRRAISRLRALVSEEITTDSAQKRAT
jgi:RNA polymerase sigma-70 factor, ECF subfamily